MRIGQLAQQTGSTTKTIRYYEQIGLVPEPQRTASGYRDYHPDAAHRLMFIRSAQTAGLSLSEIQTVIEIDSTDTSTCEHVENLLREKISDVDERIRTLRTTRNQLNRLLQNAESLQPSQCGGATTCHILYDPATA